MKKELFSGKTKEEAIENAMQALNIEKEQLFIIEKQEEKKKLFNKKIEIEVVTIPEIKKEIKEYLKTIINKMGIKIEIETKEKNNVPIFNIIGEDNAILIGKNGRTISALQIIVNQMLYTKLKNYFEFTIDVNDYIYSKNKKLEYLAKKMAKEVIRTKMPVSLDPMTAFERKTIHNALTKYENLTTYSEGEEPNRYIVIKIKED